HLETLGQPWHQRRHVGGPAVGVHHRVLRLAPDAPPADLGGEGLVEAGRDPLGRGHDWSSATTAGASWNRPRPASAAAAADPRSTAPVTSTALAPTPCGPITSLDSRSPTCTRPVSDAPSFSAATSKTRGAGLLAPTS